jgi:hypothetical protein
MAWLLCSILPRYRLKYVFGPKSCLSFPSTPTDTILWLASNMSSCPHHSYLFRTHRLLSSFPVQLFLVIIFLIILLFVSLRPGQSAHLLDGLPEEWTSS